MVNSTGPTGSVSYVADPNSPGGYTQQTSLSPTQQGLYDSYTGLQQGALGAGQTALQTLNGITPTTNVAGGQIQTGVGPQDLNQAATDASNAVYSQATSRLDPQWNLNKEQLDANLAAKGFSSDNSAGTQSANQIFNNAKNDAYNQANYSAIQSGQNEQNTLFNQALQQGTFANSAQNQGFSQGATNANLNNSAQALQYNQLAGLLGLGQGTSPTGINYTPASVAPTDVTGAYALNANVANQQYQAQQQNQNDLMSGLFKLGGSVLAAPVTGGGSLIGNFLG
jgi:hypothetical protein